jgi:ParB family chromosome partitioning protein
MERVLGTKVRIVEKSRQKGRIEIEYYSADDLDRIYSSIVGTA